VLFAAASDTYAASSPPGVGAKWPVRTVDRGSTAEAARDR
jgi:hypothetical protein